MTKEEIWGVSIERAKAFFRSQEDVTEEKEAAFAFRRVWITLEELEPAGTGMWAVRRTRLRMEGPDEEVNAIHHRYFLQFLSAGG